jgi:hypothetical protein
VILVAFLAACADGGTGPTTSDDVEDTNRRGDRSDAGQDDPDANTDDLFVEDRTEDRGEHDVAVDADGDPRPDADAETASDTDAASSDTLGDRRTDSDSSPVGCSFELGPANADRVVLLGHPFGAEVPNVGTEIRSLTLTETGELVDDGIRLDVGSKPNRIAFVPSGEFALVVSDGGVLTSVAVGGVDDLEVVDEITLPAGSYGDLRFSPSGDRVFATSFNVAETSGLSSVVIGCDGTLALEEDRFLNIRLAQSLAIREDGLRAVLLGGQAVFAPIDDDDIRLLAWVDGRWSQIGAYDIFGDSVSAGRIALSPDGRTALIPNGSPFSDEGGQMAILEVSDDSLTEVGRVMNLNDAAEARFSPDGSTAIVTLAEPGQLVVLADDGEGWAEVDRISGIGLTDQIAVVERGSLEGLILLPSVDVAAGSNVAMLRFGDEGAVSDLGQLGLGSGGPNIPGAIAVTP